MLARITFVLSALVSAIIVIIACMPAPACCPAPPPNKLVLNANQSIVIIWDAASQTQHFIRKATFNSAADDFGFIIPSPSQPELNESGDDTFPYLFELTKPEIITKPRPINTGCGCPGAKDKSASEDRQPMVRVLEEKLVAGFHATVLEASSANSLVGWLKNNGYVYSPEIEAWAKPYVELGWKFTALKVAKDKGEKSDTTVAVSALRMTFKTDRPLFPYREPDPTSVAEALKIDKRLLRIYFVAEARYQGEFANDTPWTSNVAWANKLTPEQRKKTLELLKLPETTGPAEWWLTEFEHNWPYKPAPGDVYFSRSTNQTTVKREPHIRYVAAPLPTDVMVYAIAALVLAPSVASRVRKRPRI